MADWQDLTKLPADWEPPKDEHEFIHPDAGLPFVLRRIGASCAKCGQPGFKHLKPAP